MFGIFDINTPFFFGEAIYPNGGCYGPIEHSNLCIYALVEGSASIIYDDKRRIIETGRSTIICNEDSFTVQLPRKMNTHIMWCETSYPTLLDQEKEVIQSLPPTLKTPDHLLTLLQMGISFGYANSTNVNAVRNSLAISAMNTFLYKASKIETLEEPLPRSIDKVKKYIHDNYSESMDLAKLAEIATLSPHHLARKFKEHLHVSPTTYIWQLRTEKGVDLLKHTGLTIAEAAFNSGFQNQFHFSRLVKQSYGYSPTEIRKRAWQRQEQEQIDRLKDTLITD